MQILEALKARKKSILVALVLIVFGLCVFESINSIDNAIINADVLRTMKG